MANTDSMDEVTHEVFFARIGPLNVHPRPVGQWDTTVRDYKSEWWMQDGTRRLVGISFGGRYWLTKP